MCILKKDVFLPDRYESEMSHAKFVFRLFAFSFILFVMLHGLMAQSTITGTLVHKGLTRKYRLHLPPGLDAGSPVPLVFNYHGFTSNAAQQELLSGMNAVADTARFLVCYPDGMNASWNVGWVFGSTADDVGFTSALIDELHGKYNIDLNRVYACGMSNGGFMSYRLACELSSRIAAIASVTGSMVPGALGTCKPGRPVPVLEMHGTADNVVNYNGTTGIAAPIPDVLRLWQKNNGCNEMPQKLPLPDVNPGDGTTTERWVYQNCASYGALLHYRIQNGAHTWPGSPGNAGGTARDFHGSTAIWQFFQSQTLPQTSSAQSYGQSASFEAWPNPAQDWLTLSFAADGTYRISICTPTGIVLRQMIANHRLADVELSGLPSGVYIVSVQGPVQLSSMKIIKI